MGDTSPRESKSLQEQANQMLISWSGNSLDTLPASDTRASVYEVELPTKKSIRLLTWNLRQTSSTHLAFATLEEKSFNQSQIQETQQKLIIEKLKLSIQQMDSPLIITLQGLSKQEDDPTLDLILNALNDGEDSWKAHRSKGLATLFNSSEVSCFKVVDCTYTPSAVLAGDETLLTAFVFNTNLNSCFNVANIHRVEKPNLTQAAHELTNHLLELDNVAPDKSDQATIIIGYCKQFISPSTTCTFYNPTAACLPNFSLISDPRKPYLRVDIPQTANVCMLHRRGASNYQITTPSYLLGQSQGQDYLPVECLSTDELTQNTVMALKHMVKTYTPQLLNQMEVWKKLWQKNTLITGFFTKLEAAIQDEAELMELIESGHIVSNETSLIPQMSNISLFSLNGPTAQDIEIALNREFKFDKQDSRYIRVKVDADRVGQQCLTITSRVLLDEFLEQSQETANKYPPYTYRVNHSAFLSKIHSNVRDKITFSSMNLLNYLKMIHERHPDHANHEALFEALKQAVDSYTATAYQIFEEKINNRSEWLPQLEKDLLLKEKQLLDKTIPIAKQDDSKAAALYRSIRIFLNTLWEYLKQPLKHLFAGATLSAASGAAIGAGLGFATGSVALPLIGTGIGVLGGAVVGSAAGGMIGGGLGFFTGVYKTKKYSACRLEVLREELKEHKTVHRFFINAQSPILDDSSDNSDEETMEWSHG